MSHTEPGAARPTEAAIDPVLATFLREISPVRDRILDLILFGSHARGDARPDSDYDLLVVVQERDALLRDILYDGVMRALLDHGRLVSLKIFPSKEYERLRALRTPFMERVHSEGVHLG